MSKTPETIRQFDDIIASMERFRERCEGELLKLAWQPIGTAPKDGCEFIAWDPITHRMLFTMHWDGERFMTDYERWSGQFSRWMRLPSPPEER